MEVDRFGEELVKDPETSLPSLLVTINGLFSNLKASIGHLHATHQVTIQTKTYPCGHHCLLLF